MSVGIVSASDPKIDNLFIDDPAIIGLNIEAVDASKSKGVNSVDLAKVWQIDVEAARRTIELTI